jgi:hypothetical protein
VNIARRIELYNQAVRLACDYIAQNSDLKDRAGMAVQLHEAIRHQLLAGSDDPVAVAAAAIRALEARYRPESVGR